MKKLLSLLLCFCMILPLASCSRSQPSPPPARLEVETPTSPSEEQQVANLEKLCKVWGYVKYRHPVFLKGEKDWDAELLALIPQVQEAKNGEEVNTLLYDWFVGLGEID